MAGKSDTFENDLLKLIFNGTAIAGLADNTVSAPLTNLYISLHTADVGESGTQLTNEVSYTGYARVAVARTAGGWVITGSSVSPFAAVEFGQCTLGSALVTHVAIGTAASGAGKVLYFGALSPQITVAAGVVPRITTASTISED